MPIHSETAHARWMTFPFVFQLGNAGSELDRAVTWSGKSRGNAAERAADRFLELLDWTIEDPRWNVHRKRELCRAREEWCRVWCGDRNPNELAALQEYFLQFGIAAQKK